ncbi:MAG: LbtU family siderophore porin [Thermodesulfobacteriota bacterium]
MKNLILSLLVAFAFSPALAGAAQEELSNHALLERIEQLESRLAQQDRSGADAKGPSAELGSWSERISLSGLLEVEGVYEDVDFDADGSEDASDLVLATVELGIDAELTEHVSGHVLLLWEEDDTEPIDVDEAFMLFDGGNDAPVWIRAGKMYVPFGNFSSNMISDPLTLEIGETNESAVEAGVRMGNFYALAYVFNGDVDEAGDDNHIDNFGAQMGYALEQDSFSLDASISYINNLVDSDGWEGELDSDLDDYVGGLGMHAVIEAGAFNIIGEYILALDDPEYVAGNSVEERDAIEVWNLEVGYAFTMFNKEALVGVAYQGSNNGDSFMPEGYASADDELDFIPQDRYMFTIGTEILPHTSLGLEYLHDEYEDDDSADIVTAQLALEF